MGDWENESISSNQFKVMSSWKLGDAKKLSLIERGAKNENFKIFVIFCLNFIFFNIVSQFWTQKNSNELKTTSLASVFVE